MVEPLPASRAEEDARRARPAQTGLRFAGDGPFTGRLPALGWESRYRWAVIGSDLLATVLAMALVGWLLLSRLWPAVDLAVLTVLVVAVAIAMNRGWHPSVLGQGAEEFRRLGRGLAAALVILALGGLAGGLAEMRLWVFAVVPAIAVLALAQRYQLRRILHRARKTGRCLLPVLVAGGNDTVLDLIGRTRSAAHLGWRVEAACTAGTSRPGGVLGGVPVIGGLPEVARHVRRGRYRIVAVTADAYWTPDRLRQLAWDLEGSDTEMVVAPVLMEVAGPRVHVTGVLGMPMLRVAAPVFTGTRRVVKEIVDRVGAALLLLVSLPLLIGVAVAIVVDSRGGVCYPQVRVGRDGREFTILKFRTMVRDAHALRTRMLGADDGAGPLFKLRADPRVTRVGAVLRRWSLDELPQLLNVLAGSMSLVGPRPPLPDETARYGPDVRRRLLVKPGLTGLWQVSGRSDLSWDEAVRLDLRYVEDWSLALDALILWKTARAVLSGHGAY
ncbi:MAG TPA: sugar transferase [Pseudonocardiaceae bacterium]|jgi:exopolysaccharide biosynthesis polyprenyl glycosylphosphotransferase